MSKKQPTPQPPADQRRLIVWGERRDEPDWDRFLAALIAMSLRDAEQLDDATEGNDE